MVENTEGKKISQLSNYKGGFDAAADAGAVFPVAVGAENYRIAVRDMQAAIQNLVKAALSGAITQDDFVTLKNKLLLEIENTISSISGTTKLDRLITVDDNSKDTSVSDKGGTITLPLAVTIPSASASNTQNTITTAQPLRTFLKSVRDNIAHIFTNKQDKLVAGTNIVINGNTISASGLSVDNNWQDVALSNFQDGVDLNKSEFVCKYNPVSKIVFFMGKFKQKSMLKQGYTFCNLNKDLLAVTYFMAMHDDLGLSCVSPIIFKAHPDGGIGVHTFTTYNATDSFVSRVNYAFSVALPAV